MEVIKLHDKYYEKIRIFIVSLIRDEWMADDLVQETFIKVDKHLCDVGNPDSLASWIYKIAYHVCMDYLRNNQTVFFKKTEQISSQETGIRIEEKIEQRQMGSCVRGKINMLPDNLRSVLLLFDLEEFSHNEISLILGISVENAKTMLHRSLKMLKKILEKECCFEKDERDVFVCVPKNQAAGQP